MMWALLVVNHQSNFDPLLVGLPLKRPVSYMARSTLFPIPLIGWLLRNTYVVPIDREAARAGAIRELVARLERGFLVGMFPEGTRTADGRLGEFKPGFIALVRRSRLPIVPVGIAGAYEAYPPASDGSGAGGLRESVAARGVRRVVRAGSGGRVGCGGAAACAGLCR